MQISTVHKSRNGLLHRRILFKYIKQIYARLFPAHNYCAINIIYITSLSNKYRGDAV